MKPKYVDNVKLCYMDTDSFTKILQNTQKKDLIHQIMNAIDHYLKERIKK